VVSVADSTEKAAFLVASHVLPPQWRTVSVPGALTSETLETTIERLLPQSQQEKGSLPRTFPFRIDGHFQNITLAIVDGRLLPADARGEAAVGKANVLQPLKDVDGTLVGFFSVTDGAPFNHSHRHAHVHAIIPGRQATGHAQSFVLAPGAKLLMP
jgi:alpha-acetolactate decarboxylase